MTMWKPLCGQCWERNCVCGARAREDAEFRRRFAEDFPPRSGTVTGSSSVSVTPSYDVEPLKRALTFAGISSPESREELALNWAEYAQKVIRFVDDLATELKAMK